MSPNRETPLRVADVARRTAFSEPVIRKMARRGELPCHRVGRRIFFLPAEPGRPTGAPVSTNAVTTIMSATATTPKSRPHEDRLHPRPGPGGPRPRHGET